MNTEERNNTPKSLALLEIYLMIRYALSDKRHIEAVKSTCVSGRRTLRLQHFPLSCLRTNACMENPELDPFNRQKGIDKWDQTIIEKQVCLVLGCGGIGSSVAFALARLGVARIILWDFDTVDTTNLNRQILFHTADVGKPKVEAAV